MATKSTNFPRTYIIERIKARQASLRSKIAEAEKELAKAYPEYRQAMAEWARDQKVKFKEQTDAVDKELNSLTNPNSFQKPEDIKRLRKAIEAASYEHVRTESAPSLSGYGEPHDKRILAFKVASQGYDQSLKFDKELADLDHALAYLEGTPVEEFSLTGLKQLGLLGVVQFSIGQARGR